MTRSFAIAAFAALLSVTAVQAAPLMVNLQGLNPANPQDARVIDAHLHVAAAGPCHAQVERVNNDVTVTATEFQQSCIADAVKAAERQIPGLHLPLAPISLAAN